MGGATPTTVFEGAVSGLAHPVIGLDHLAFNVALGLVAAFTASAFRVPMAFILSTTVGVLLHSTTLSLPLTEVIVALSVLAVGLAFVLNRLPEPRLWILFAAAAGVFHGYAFGEAVGDAEAAVVAAYVGGLAATQFLLALVSKTFVDVMLAEEHSIGTGLRVVGALLVLLGAAFFTTSILPA
jgi:urease accessory protein